MFSNLFLSRSPVPFHTPISFLLTHSSCSFFPIPPLSSYCFLSLCLSSGESKNRTGEALSPLYPCCNISIFMKESIHYTWDPGGKQEQYEARKHMHTHTDTHTEEDRKIMEANVMWVHMNRNKSAAVCIILIVNNKIIDGFGIFSISALPSHLATYMHVECI